MVFWNSNSSVATESPSEELIALENQLNQLRESKMDTQHILESLERSQAVIEFEPDGTIIRANDNFLKTVGYSSSEIVGQHHRMFVDPVYASSAAYRDFWNSLQSGEFKSAEFKRFANGNRVVWIQATYNPVLDEHGRVVKVIKFATDITRQKESSREIQDRSQAVIEFLPDGTILEANDLFLATVGYTLDQIQGQHHRMFMNDVDKASEEYRTFWSRLASGTFIQGEFRRVNKNGDEIWLQGAYNPILDMKGNVERVVKSVSDITDRKRGEEQSREVGKMIAESVSEMSNAIGEISERISRTASLAKDAESNAGNATQEVEKLADCSESINKVVDLIQDLADQTNLLALNATIEAARAGEAGRGFSVVASEVKELASQTGLATNNIRDSVKAIQSNIQAVVSTIQIISGGVSEVSNNTDSIASSVEEQSIVMSGLSSNAEQLRTIG